MKNLTMEDAQIITGLVDLPGFEFVAWEPNPGYVKATAVFGNVAKGGILMVSEYLRRHVKLCLGGTPYELDSVSHDTRLDEAGRRVPNGEYTIRVIAKTQEEA